MLDSLSVLSKSGIQIVLQTSIMMITWAEDRSALHLSYRILNVMFAVLVLASSASDHHYFESSGKNVNGKLINVVGLETIN